LIVFLLFSEREKKTLNAILDLALSSAFALGGSLFIKEGEGLFLVAGKGVYAHHLGEEKKASFSAHVFETGRPLFVEDVRNTRPERKYSLLLPIRDSEGKTIGVLSLNRATQPFTEEDWENLNSVVANIALLLEENTLRRHREKLIIVLSEIINFFGTSANLLEEKAIFERMFRAVRLLLRVQQGAFFKISAQRPYRVFSHDFPKALNFKALHIPQDVLLNKDMPAVVPWDGGSFLLVVPFSLSVNRNSFVFVSFLGERLDPLDGLVLSIIFRLGEMHLEHLVLFRKNERLVREKERNRMARELHDGLAQILTSIQFYLHFLQEEKDIASSEVYEKLRSLVRLGIEESRSILSELRGRPVSREEFQRRIEEMARVFAEGSFSLHLNVEISSASLPLRIFQGLFFILQEALSNVQKHARARDVWLEIREKSNLLLCRVKDNGVGFQKDGVDVYDDLGHFGLVNLKERVRLLGGRMSVTSSPLQGTEIKIRIPLYEV
jgi:signal transduction histidine kinase